MEQNNAGKKTALLVMDVQEATIKMLPDNAGFVQSVNRAIQTARSNNIAVIYVVVGFRKGYPEVSPNNKSFSVIQKDHSRSFDTEEAARVHASVAPQPGDIIITKKRVSAFTGSDLEVVLRSLGITHLVLTGIATSGVVLSTLREAADKDYAISVLSDCCADRDEEVHRVLTSKVFTRQADVMSGDEWVISQPA
ncbi:MAG: isochorismatase family cysteine hydrolase [Bacteroidota bacterium]|nr:isochorismatase family cysteine hydrolase [Bacteroidota bacterium]MDP4213696.1 isochorismatase family cysteine hydrolase [Bacteroidota bacterium]MDP4250154.1 isochorismatase family cysteine hydrolase [Bacteroidota bacterium]